MNKTFLLWAVGMASLAALQPTPVGLETSSCSEMTEPRFEA
jgi:hypothetical protein